MAKLFVGDVWETNYNSDVISFLRTQWNGVFSRKNKKLKEGKRCDSLAMMCGYFISAHERNFSLFDKRYDNLKDYLNVTLTDTDREEIALKISDFLDIMKVIYSTEMFGCITNGIPSRKHVAPIWKKICEEEMTPELMDNMKRFYKAVVNDEDLTRKYLCIRDKGSNGETSDTKINNIISLINKWSSEQ
jgi:hypothetical protein